MAEKKPSKYSDRGTIGTAEELDAYGVWVKSEPQDLTAGIVESVNFDAEAVPYEADFDTGFGGTEESDYGFAGLGQETPDIQIDVEENDNVNFNDGITAQREQGSEEESTRLLMRIANELSSIRAELSTLKKEFAGVHIESVPGGKAETRGGGFFDGEEGDDEKITLTGDEMENILTSAGFSEGEDLNFDTQREADEAALKEISKQNESAAEAEEEIEIDFNNLGIKLDNDAEAQDEFPPLEAGTADDFEISSFDGLSLDDMPVPEEIPSEDMPTLEEQAFAEELAPLDPLEEDEELRNLRLEGAAPFVSAPDESVYLESDAFALDGPGLEDTSLEDASFEENISSEDTVFEDAISGENTADLSFGEASFDLDIDDFSIENPTSSEEVIPAESLPSLEEESGVEQTSDIGSLDISDFSAESLPSLEEESDVEQTSDAGSLDISDFSAESLPSLEEESGVEQTFDAGSLDLSEAVIDEPDLSAGLVEAPLEEPVLGDISFGDDISLDIDDFGSSIDLDVKEDSGLVGDPVETLAVNDLALDIDTGAELNGEDPGLTDDLIMDDAAAGVEFDTEDSGLAGGLALDDFGTGIDLDVKETDSPAGSLSDEPADSFPDDNLDDGLTGVIPEGLEVNAEEAPVSLDDDLEAFAEDLSIDDGAALPGEISLSEAPAAKTTEADAGRDVAIPADFKSELKNVLSYMDHLLESLPEDKIEEFAKSEYFDSYKKIFKELGLV